MTVSGQGNDGRRLDRRMQVVSAQQDHMGMLLKQMGADVRQINGLVCFVRFALGDTELFYVYNLNADDQYYLQRVKPYPMSAGVFADPAQIAEYIERDVQAFREAAKSGQFDNFVDINLRLSALSRALEDTFMKRDVSKAELTQLGFDLREMERKLADVRKNAKPLHSEA